MVKYFTGRAYDARFDLYLRLGGRQVSPGGEFLLCRQKEPKPVGGSDSPKPLNGAVGCCGIDGDRVYFIADAHLGGYRRLRMDDADHQSHLGWSASLSIHDLGRGHFHHFDKRC